MGGGATCKRADAPGDVASCAATVQVSLAYVR